MRIYIVIGSTGEYSDRREWLVRAFPKQEHAQLLVVTATREAKRLYAEYASSGYMDYHKIPKDSNPVDPSMETDYTGVGYHYVEVELEERNVDTSL